jgi:hypothetical protein
MKMQTLLNANVLQWLGCMLGLGGALLLASKTQFAGYGVALFLVSNGFWIAFGLVTSAPGLVVMQIGFTLTSLVGVWTWIVRPWHDKRSLRVLPRGMYRVPSKPLARSSLWRRV